ncbi:MAG: co-chaperone YbbN, partial [Marmoricola sp.]
MTEQSFSRPGAVDLSGLQQPAAGSTGGGGAVSSAYVVDVDEQSFQTLLESSMTAPVLLAFYSSGRSPESVRLADDLQVVVNELEGRLLLGRGDVDAVPHIAQAMQLPSVPGGVLVGPGRPMPRVQAPPPREDL